MRSRASDCRRALLIGPLRGSSSSFCDAERLPGHARMSLDLMAIRPRDPQARKVVRDYEPAIAPPMFVSLDRMVFLSGLTDTMAALDDQIPAIAQAIRHSLRQAGSKITAAKRVDVFLAKSEDPARAMKLIAAEFPDLPCPLGLTTVEGYSAPEKRIEIEVTAVSIESV
jgi:enamine deaminase RidA (YjgF/YER057c/UK114 family)